MKNKGSLKRYKESETWNEIYREGTWLLVKITARNRKNEPVFKLMKIADYENKSSYPFEIPIFKIGDVEA